MKWSASLPQRTEEVLLVISSARPATVKTCRRKNKPHHMRRPNKRYFVVWFRIHKTTRLWLDGVRLHIKREPATEGWPVEARGHMDARIKFLRRPGVEAMEIVRIERFDGGNTNDYYDGV